ncbi:MAG: hypothetical protein U0V74_13370 [Chitinophagales bacterium]
MKHTNNLLSVVASTIVFTGIMFCLSSCSKEKLAAGDYLVTVSTSNCGGYPPAYHDSTYGQFTVHLIAPGHGELVLVDDQSPLAQVMSFNRNPEWDEEDYIFYGREPTVEHLRVNTKEGKLEAYIGYHKTPCGHWTIYKGYKVQ